MVFRKLKITNIKKISYHNHTIWSDGYSTIEEVIHEAKRKRTAEIGISDHIVLLPFNKKVEWSMNPSLLQSYIEELEELKKYSTTSFRIKKGLEVDYIHSTFSKLMSVLNSFPFDYFIGSVHFVDGFPLDSPLEVWEKMSEKEINDVWRDYWRLVGQMVDTKKFKIIGHLGYPKWSLHFPTEDLSDLIISTLEKISYAGSLIEINTSGWDNTFSEQYPSIEILKKAKSKGIKFVLSSDSHKHKDLDKHFRKAEGLLNLL